MDFRVLIPYSYPSVRLLHGVPTVIILVVWGRSSSSSHVSKEVLLSVVILGALSKIVPGLRWLYLIMVSSYFASYWDMSCDLLDSSVYVSTPIRNSIVVDYVYRCYVVSIWGYETRVDLFMLNMVDFDMILCMDWLSPYHDILDYHTKTMKLAIPGLPRVEWRGSLGHIPSGVIFFLKA
ncbi:uncharacterized protein [Nicotiana tomentosiformis]|uniref:uncharacterized protein n=1 Tax=Nicotiana tomentosiformis TaxID=4098 RepID=UPI00388C4C43